MKYRWVQSKTGEQDVVDRLSRELNELPEALTRALVGRGIETFEQARAYFRPSRDQQHDPFLMRDMQEAADRLARAVTSGERVLVFGDYDVDGTTAVSLMVSFLRELAIDVSSYIPDRFRDGYGLNEAGIDLAHETGCTLIVALDCGITGLEAARYTRSLGIDLIICDHHTPGATLPDAIAVLDPKRADCDYPFKELTGCGVGYKLAQATLHTLGLPTEAADEYLDLVALSIASDIVPIVDENRVLMTAGLQRIKQAPRLGLATLATAARVDLQTCDTGQIVFTIGPRINAAGRLSDAQLAVDLLTTRDPDGARSWARELNRLNEERREIDQRTLSEALDLVAASASTCMEHALVLHRPDWNVGVVGIVASRLVERFHRPTVMLASQNGEAKGSARSIANLNIYEALRACESLLTRFGGHMYAAGISLPEDNVPAFRDQFNAEVGALMTPDLLCPEIAYDSPIELVDVTPRFWRVLQQFGPFGPENRSPVFLSRDIEVISSPSIIGDGHLKFRVRQRNGTTSRAFEVIGFRMHEHLPVVRSCRNREEPLEMLFSIDENRFRGQTTLQLKLKDLRPHSADAPSPSDLPAS